jgi:hypothetical protein
MYFFVRALLTLVFQESSVEIAIVLLVALNKNLKKNVMMRIPAKGLISLHKTSESGCPTWIVVQETL